MDYSRRTILGATAAAASISAVGVNAQTAARPNIVVIQEGDEITTRNLDPVIARVALAQIRLLEILDPLRLNQWCKDSSRVVGRPVVDHDDLVVGHCLIEYRLERPTNEVSMLKCRDNNADLWAGAQCNAGAAHAVCMGQSDSPANPATWRLLERPMDVESNAPTGARKCSRLLRDTHANRPKWNVMLTRMTL